MYPETVEFRNGWDLDRAGVSMCSPKSGSPFFGILGLKLAVNSAGLSAIENIIEAAG